MPLAQERELNAPSSSPAIYNSLLDKKMSGGAVGIEIASLNSKPR